jgi:hypothetical protein
MLPDICKRVARVFLCVMVICTPYAVSRGYLGGRPPQLDLPVPLIRFLMVSVQFYINTYMPAGVPEMETALASIFGGAPEPVPPITIDGIALVTATGFMMCAWARCPAQEQQPAGLCLQALCLQTLDHTVMTHAHATAPPGAPFCMPLRAWYWTPSYGLWVVLCTGSHRELRTPPGDASWPALRRCSAW